MTEIAARLKDELLRLSEEDRVELAHALRESIESPDDEADEADPAWIAELESRSAGAAAGTSVEQPFREAIEELRKDCS